MQSNSESQDIRGWTLPTLVSRSIWAVSYALVVGVRVVETAQGDSGRLVWRLDNEGGKAKRALDEWRSRKAVVNGRDLLDAHSRLIGDIRSLA